MSEKFRSRLFVAVLYPDDESHVECISKLNSNGYNFAAILHDKDIYEDGENEGEIKKAHWHIIVRFKNAVWNTAVAKELGIQPNYLEVCRDGDAALLYLVHYGKEEKYQYEYEEVFGPMKVKLATLLADTDEGTRALNILDIIETSPGPIGYTELIRKAVAAGVYGDLIRMGSFAVGAMREHNDSFSDARSEAADCQGFGEFVKQSKNMDFVRRCQTLEKHGMPLEPLEGKPYEPPIQQSIKLL